MSKIAIPFIHAPAPHSDVPLRIQKGCLTTPDEKFIKAIDRELQIFNFFIKRIMEKFRAANGLPGPARELLLKAALRARLEATSFPEKDVGSAQRGPIDLTLGLNTNVLNRMEDKRVGVRAVWALLTDYPEKPSEARRRPPCVSRRFSCGETKTQCHDLEPSCAIPWAYLF